MAEGKVLSIAIVSIVLLITVVVFGSFQTSSRSTFQESLSQDFSEVSNPEVITVDSPPVQEDSYTLYNDSSKTEELVEDTDYNVQSLEDGEFEITSDVDGTVYIDYTGHTGEGYSTFSKTANNTYGGFNLAAVLPIAIAGVAVLGIVISAFVGIGA